MASSKQPPHVNCGKSAGCISNGCDTCINQKNSGKTTKKDCLGLHFTDNAEENKCEISIKEYVGLDFTDNSKFQVGRKRWMKIRPKEARELSPMWQPNHPAVRCLRQKTLQASWNATPLRIEPI